MNDHQDPINEESIRRLLVGLGERMHISPEMIIAYAHGLLSSDGGSRVASHLKACKECSDLFDVAQKAFTEEGNSEFEDAEPMSPSPIPPRVAAKAELVSMFCSKREDLVTKICKLVLPRDSWSSIRPTIIAMRNWKRPPPSERQEDQDVEELPVAAFSSVVGPEGKRNLKAIGGIVNFIDLVCDLLLNCCNSIDEVRQELPKRADEVMVMLDEFALEKDVKQKMLDSILESLSQDCDPG